MLAIKKRPYHSSFGAMRQSYTLTIVYHTGMSNYYHVLNTSSNLLLIYSDNSTNVKPAMSECGACKVPVNSKFVSDATYSISTNPLLIYSL